MHPDACPTRPQATTTKPGVHHVSTWTWHAHHYGGSVSPSNTVYVQLVYNKNLFSPSHFTVSRPRHECCDRTICLGMLYIWHNSADMIHFSVRKTINMSKVAEVFIINAYLRRHVLTNTLRNNRNVTERTNWV